MKELYIGTVQERFTAYIQVAVLNKRVRYCNKKKQQSEKEFVNGELLEKAYVDFEVQHKSYQTGLLAEAVEKWLDTTDFINLLETKVLAKEIEQLKDMERQVIIAKVYGEMTFEEIAKFMNQPQKRIESMYYYSIRKLRNKLEAWKDEL